jgi:hypothetical protein
MDNQVKEALDKALGFADTALAQHEQDLQKIAQLENQVRTLQADQDRIVLEKVAAAKSHLFDTRTLDLTLQRLEDLNVIDSQGREKLASQIKTNPNVILPFMIKLATTLMSAPGEGESIDKAASGQNELDPKDPDGWGLFAQGKRVPVIKH